MDVLDLIKIPLCFKLLDIERTVHILYVKQNIQVTHHLHLELTNLTNQGYNYSTNLYLIKIDFSFFFFFFAWRSRWYPINRIIQNRDVSMLSFTMVYTVTLLLQMKDKKNVHIVDLVMDDKTSQKNSIVLMYHNSNHQK